MAARTLEELQKQYGGKSSKGKMPGGPGHGPGPRRGGGPGVRAKGKPKNTKATVKRLLSYLSKYKFRLVLVLVCMFFNTLASLTGAYILRPVINALVGQSELKFLGMSFDQPLEYLSFVYLMEKSNIVLTDSGGIQEEAPGLGKPVLVMRDTTERPEALEAGTVKLVGTDYDKIVNEVSLLLEDQAHYDNMSKAVNPYGDGLACGRIVEVMA